MYKTTNKKGFLKRKFISAFLLVSIFLSQFYATTTYAMDLNQLAANVMDVAKEIGNAIMKVGEDVFSAGIATTLNTFAQQLASNTVQGLATNGKGQQPLYFSFPLEDMLQQTMDQVTGDYLDKLSATLRYDVCKPLNADLDWKFKLVLNIIPEQRDNNVGLTPPACTLSKFVDAVNQSFANITESIRKTFAADCFDEFLPKYVSTDLNSLNPLGVFNESANSLISLGSIGSLTSFSYENIKDYYLYNVVGLDSTKAYASYFTKRDNFYIQNQLRPECSETMPACFIRDTNVYVGQPINDSCAEYDLKLNIEFLGKSALEKREVSSCRKSEFVNADSVNACARSITVNNISGDLLNLDALSLEKTLSGACVSKSAPYKKNDVYVADTTKQKKFLTQYKSCYLAKVNQAFKGFIEVGQIPKQKIQDQRVKLGCTDIVNSLITPGYTKNAVQFYAAYDLYFQKNLWAKDKVLGKKDSEMYQKVLRSALLSSKGVDGDGNQLTANGDDFANYLKSKISFFNSFEQSIVNCNGVSNPQGSKPEISVSNCVNQEGKNGIVSSNDTTNLVDTSVVSVFKSNFADLMIREGDTAAFDSNSMFVDNMEKPTKLCFRKTSALYCVGLRKGNEFIENTAKIEKIKEELIDVCLKNAVREVAMLDYAQLERNKAYIAQQEKEKALEVENKQNILQTNFGKSDYKPVTEPVSGQVKSTPGMVDFNLTQALGVSENMVQPTGNNLVMDSVKIFVTTLLSEGSKKLMEGLFVNMFPTDAVDQDLSALNGIGDLDLNLDDVEVVDDNNCSVPGPLDNGSICIAGGVFNHGSCKSCYCESKIGNLDANNISTYGTCQNAPVSR